MVLKTQNQGKGIGVKVEVELNRFDDVLEKDFAGHGMPEIQVSTEVSKNNIY